MDQILAIHLVSTESFTDFFFLPSFFFTRSQEKESRPIVFQEETVVFFLLLASFFFFLNLVAMWQKRRLHLGSAHFFFFFSAFFAFFSLPLSFFLFFFTEFSGHTPPPSHPHLQTRKTFQCTSTTIFKVLFTFRVFIVLFIFVWGGRFFPKLVCKNSHFILVSIKYDRYFFGRLFLFSF